LTPRGTGDRQLPASRGGDKRSVTRPFLD